MYALFVSLALRVFSFVVYGGAGAVVVVAVDRGMLVVGVAVVMYYGVDVMLV